MPRVTFQPSGVSVEVEEGLSLLDAARQANIPIRNDCGGQGACGRCRVEVRRGAVRRLTTRHTPGAGADLACRTLTTADELEVFVPAESREVDTEVSVGPAELPVRVLPSEGSLVERWTVELTPPSLEDNTADSERLLRVLHKRREAEYVVPFSCLRDLPQRLREAQWRPDVTLSVEPWGHRVLDAGPGAGPLCLAAVDIGTTTIKAQLLGPQTSFAASCYNSQVMFGPDVISRIIHCERGGGRGTCDLQECAAADIERLLDALTRASGVQRDDIWGIVVSGNTTMMHLLLGICPVWLRREPYVGCSYLLPSVDPADVGLRVNERGRLLGLPSVSAFVGADISAGVVATGLAERAAPCALIDLGTNGEIVVGCREFMVCCSASAGPAFEGGASASGTRARPGAIDRVTGGTGLEWHTIGEAAPLGICGTGYLDLLAALVRRGTMDRTGHFTAGSPGVRRDDDGLLEYVVVPAEQGACDRDIVLTQADVDNLVRAKAAIYAAGTVLLKSLGMGWGDLESIMLAGGFGERLNEDNAVAVGLLPDVPRDRIRFVGNTSLRGAVMAAADADNYRKAREAASAMTYFELSTHPDFMEQFVSACFLPHTHTEEFPSVASGS
jgi:uncharacterized 2Fe-2S/4Fe-4S cluster protein (DUF4445 family)